MKRLRKVIMNQILRIRSSNQGVTIIELLVVIFIIGLFILYFTRTTLNRVADNARITTTRQKMVELRKAIIGNPEMISGGEYIDVGFKGDVGRFPRHLLELVQKPTDADTWNPFTEHGWNGPYIRNDGNQTFMFDAWGDSIKFLIDISDDTIGLISKGLDGELYGTNSLLKNDDIQILF